MTSTRRFPWLWASFFLLVGIAGLIAYDVSTVNGNFPKSATGKLLNDLGLLEHSQYAWRKTLSTSARGYLWLEANAPIYYAATVEACKPYAQLSRDFFTIALKKIRLLNSNVFEYINEKGMAGVAMIDQYAPGVIDTLNDYAVTYGKILMKFTVAYTEFVSDFFTTKVFVGEWAPEILQNKTQIALNATRFHMTSYFHWFREQVNIYSEIP